ncbi:MAG: hypothetical protein ACI9TH_004198 [Kiritimatiellia bacterium]|jgi:uncharacterized protein (TIGR01244 family)
MNARKSNAISLLLPLSLLVISGCMLRPSTPPQLSNKLGIAHCFQLGEIYLAGQPSEAELQTAAEHGLKTVINLRMPDENDWNEEAITQKMGLSYYNVPFKSPDSLTEEVFDNVRRLLATSGNSPTLLHCKSGNRVGAVWLTYRALDEGVDL